MRKTSHDSSFWPPVADLFLCSFLLFLGLSVTFNLPVLLIYKRSLTEKTDYQDLVKKLAESRAENDRLQQKILFLESHVRELTDRLDQSSQREADLRKQLTDTFALLDQSRKENDQLRKTIRELDDKLNQEKERRLLAESENLRLQTEIKELKNELKQEKEKRLLAEAENERLRMALAAARTGLATAEQTIKAFGNPTPPMIFLTDDAEAGQSGFSFEPGSATLTEVFKTRFSEQKIVARILQGIAAYDAHIIEVMGHTDVVPVHGRGTGKVVPNMDFKLGSYITNPTSIPLKPKDSSIPGIASNLDLGMLRAIAVKGELEVRFEKLLAGYETNREAVLQHICDEMTTDKYPRPRIAVAAQVVNRLRERRYRLYSAGAAVLPLNKQYDPAYLNRREPDAVWFQPPDPKNKSPKPKDLGDPQRRRIEIRFSGRIFEQKEVPAASPPEPGR